MTTKQFTCVACGSSVETESAESETRCGSCGTKFAGPWTDPEVVRSPVPDDEFAGAGPTPTATDGAGGDETAVQLDAGSRTVTVTITVEVDPGGA